MISGRVYFLTDYTLTTDVTVTFTGSVPLVLVLRAGTWFANQLAAWVYLTIAHQAVTGNDYSITFVDHYDNANLGKVRVSWDSGLFTSMVFTNDTDAVQPFWQWLGGTSATFTFTASVYETPSAVPGFYAPYWPLRSYQRGMQHMQGLGGAQRAFAGNVGSWGTAPRETIEIAVNIDRQNGTELEAWYALWRTRWRIGRTVSLYFFDETRAIPSVGTNAGAVRLDDDITAGFAGSIQDLEDISATGSEEWLWRIAQCDQLQFAEEPPRLRPARVVEHKNLVSYDGPHKFQRASIGGDVLRGYTKIWSIL